MSKEPANGGVDLMLEIWNLEFLPDEGGEWRARQDSNLRPMVS